MTAHRFDPWSAALGVVAVVVGVLVATGSTTRLADDGGWWLTIAVFAIGVIVAGSAMRRLTGSGSNGRSQPGSLPS